MSKITSYTAATKMDGTEAFAFDQAGTTKQGPLSLLRGVLDQAATAGNSVTGTASETTLATINIAAGAMGANGKIEVNADFSYTNSANAKTLRIKLGGTTLWSGTPTATTGLAVRLTIRNRNAANSQRWRAQHVLSSGTWGDSSGTAAIDTASATTITITAQLANTGETITLEGRDAVLSPKA